ncbi:MAG: hypothetical protein LUE93_13425, partial [Bacteroides sp.]|nr:hypothetical protein [Bacteroides sp.]
EIKYIIPNVNGLFRTPVHICVSSASGSRSPAAQVSGVAPQSCVGGFLFLFWPFKKEKNTSKTYKPSLNPRLLLSIDNKSMIFFFNLFGVNKRTLTFAPIIVKNEMSTNILTVLNLVVLLIVSVVVVPSRA